MLYYLEWMLDFNDHDWLRIINISNIKTEGLKYEISKDKYLLGRNLDLTQFEFAHTFNTRVNMNISKDGILHFMIGEKTCVNTGKKTYTVKLTGSKSTLTSEIKSYMRKILFRNYILDPINYENTVDTNIKILKNSKSSNFTDEFGNNILIITGTKAMH